MPIATANGHRRDRVSHSDLPIADILQMRSLDSTRLGIAVLHPISDQCIHLQRCVRIESNRRYLLHIQYCTCITDMCNVHGNGMSHAVVSDITQRRA